MNFLAYYNWCRDGENMDYYLDLVQSVKKKYRLCKEAFLPQAVFSDESENFRKPAEPSAEDFVEISILTGRNNASAVCLCVDDKRLLMERVENGRVFDRYRVVLPPTEEAANYFFQIIYNETSYYYTRNGVSQEFPMDGYFRLLRNFQTPAWARGAVMYQIFVDRFCNGDPSNDVKTGEYNYLENQVQGVKDWYAQPEDGDFCHFYGGDLQGILQKMDYLQNLGVEVLYLNPIFVSPSSHKYDIQDYDHVDPHFGVIVEDYDKVVEPGEKNSQAKAYITRTTSERNLMESDALFIRLVEEAHKRGMRVILDGVFNHCGAFHKWLDREEVYKYQKKGAYYCKQSPYHDYFYWKEDGSYEGWWDYPNHPKLNMENCSALYWEIMRIGQKWVSPPYNADGWRLDVAADVGKSEEFNHKFWHDFRSAVKKANPEALILAEHYGDAEAWLRGDQWDGVMNYDAFMEPVSWYFTGISKHSTESRPDLKNNNAVFWDTIRYQMGRMPAQAAGVAMNELSNHDHSRFLTRTNGRTGRLHTDGAQAANRGVNKAVFREAVLLQMTWPGAPTVYYGDEAGVTGWTDPDNRRPFPWNREDDELVQYHKILIGLRKAHISLRKGSLKSLDTEDGILAYGRFCKEERCLIVCNNREEAVQVSLPVWQIGVQSYGKMEVLLKTKEMDYFTEKELLSVENGMIQLEMPPHSGILMKEV